MKSNKNIRLMYAIVFLQGMVFYASIATLYRQAFGVTIFQITIIESVCLALTIILELPWGIVADKIGYKKTIVICSGLYLISKIVFWSANGFAMFLIERIILSFVISGLSGVDVGFLYLSSNKKKFQNVLSKYNNFQTLGLLLAIGCTTFLNDKYRLRSFLTVITYIIAFLLSLMLTEVKNNDKHEEKNSFTVMLIKVLKNKRLLVFLIAIALFNETHQTITVFLNQLQYVKSGATTSIISIAYIIVTITGFIGIYSSKITKKLGVKLFGSIIFISGAVACFILAITNNIIISILSIVIIRVGFSLLQPLQSDLQNKQVISKNRATELSINAVIIDAVGISTNLLYGKLADVNVSYAMHLGSFFCVISLICFLLWTSKKIHILS